MIAFLFRKMWKNKWLMFCLLIGNILLLGVVATTPMYVQATMQRILQQNLRQVQWRDNQHPAIVEIHYTFNALIPEHILPHFRNTRYVIVPELHTNLGLPVITTFEVNVMNYWHLLPIDAREVSPRVRNMTLMGTEFEDHVTVVSGRMPARELVEGNIIEVLATEFIMLSHNLLLDELMLIPNVPSDLYARIVGIYEHVEGSELFWSTVRYSTNNTLLISNNLVHEHFIQNYRTGYRITSHWYHLLDYSEISTRRVNHYLEVIAEFNQRFGGSAAWEFAENFSETIEYHMEGTATLATTLWVLQVPLYLLMIIYIYMVSQQTLQLERSEISVLKSRGVSRWQIMGIYLIQSLILLGLSAPIGLALGFSLTHLLGASSGFLYLVNRAALNVVVTSTVLMYVVIAMFFSFLTMFLPVIGFSRVTIVEHKQRKRGKIGAKSLWQRFFLDILCLGVALYGLFSFRNNRELMANTIAHDISSVDPLLFISSSLFIIGAGLLALRLFPYVTRIVFFIGRRFWSPQAYASLIRIVRTAGEEQFIMMFLVITLAVGIFSAHSARTINTNNDHRITHLAGTDLMFREFWPSNNPPGMGGFEGDMDLVATTTRQLVYQEPDFERFTSFEEVDAITRVFREDANIMRSGVTIPMADFMAVESNTFGETIWFRDDFLPIHINHFLNALAENPDGVLLSYNFRTDWGFELGDIINVQHVRAESYHNISLQVVGFVERWPGFSPMERTRLPNDEWRVDERSLVVANLGHLQTQWGVMPYQIWMRTNTPTNTFFYDFQAEQGLRIVEFFDGKGALVESRSDPILQGTNGVLTMSFIVTLLICFVGFLIYWVLSIRQRVLQFGIFRAMGISMGRIFRMLIIEQFLVTFVAIAIGAVVGEVAARLFVPLIQISYTAADQVIPLLIVVEIRDYINLYSFIGAMVLLCLVVLAWYVSKIKIAQALKLGED